MTDLHEDIIDWFYDSPDDGVKPLTLVNRVKEYKEFMKEMRGDVD